PKEGLLNPDASVATAVPGELARPMQLTMSPANRKKDRTGAAPCCFHNCSLLIISPLPFQNGNILTSLALRSPPPLTPLASVTCWISPTRQPRRLIVGAGRCRSRL